MGRTKERQKFLHQPSTQEIFHCLETMPIYSNILLNNISTKPYIDFLKWLLEVNFFQERPGKINLTKLALEAKSDTSKISKWIRQIYQDIFELNENNPGLFQNEETKVTICAKNGDNYCSFNTCLSLLPREFESIDFYFIHGKIGTSHFWVQKIDHIIEHNNICTIINLQAGYVNKYREYLPDKALFHQWIGFIDLIKKQDHEIDVDLHQFHKMYK